MCMYIWDHQLFIHSPLGDHNPSLNKYIDNKMYIYTWGRQSFINNPLGDHNLSLLKVFRLCIINIQRIKFTYIPEAKNYLYTIHSVNTTPALRNTVVRHSDNEYRGHIRICPMNIFIIWHCWGSLSSTSNSLTLRANESGNRVCETKY